jgi:hypothetical protein
MSASSVKRHAREAYNLNPVLSLNPVSVSSAKRYAMLNKSRCSRLPVRAPDLQSKEHSRLKPSLMQRCGLWVLQP